MIRTYPRLCARAPLMLAGLALVAPCSRAAERIPIRVIVLSGFEVGNDTGDAPGEFQYWYEREKLFDRVDVPGAQHPLCRNAEGLYGDVGVTTLDPQVNPAVTGELIM